ncbi:hypothetical protein HZC30_03770 [Candidatus Woesearchaeota archaeon]|nr:hypothetical protein [Candidatus Woesearchaeota archaeon]
MSNKLKLKLKIVEDLKMKNIQNTLKKSIGLVFVALLMLMAVASAGVADSGAATFKVSVNDYPNHKDYSKSKNLEGAYVNMYIVQLVESKDAFKVIDTQTKNTGTGSDPTVVFQVEKDEMVYFEGFRTLDNAKKGAEQKSSMLWTAPPYKNFGTADNQLCQTHFTKTNEFLQYSKDYACAESLSTPFQDVDVIAEEDKPASEAQKEPTKKVDLAVMSLTHSDNAFKAKVCNLGEKSVSEFKIKYTANGKENILTYVPTLTPGNCVDIYSWGWGYFGLDTKEKLVSASAQAKVDPLNEIAESNEDNNQASIAPSGIITPEEPTKVEPLNYYVFPRSKDISARGDVAKYVSIGNGKWKLVDVEAAVLSKVNIVSPTESKEGYSYRAEMGLKEGEKVVYLAFYPASPIPTELDDLATDITNVFVPILVGKAQGEKVVACSATEGCAKKYASHAQELLWYQKDENKYYTIYEAPDLEKMGDKLFQDNGDSVVAPWDMDELKVEPPISVPTAPTAPFKPELGDEDSDKPLPAYDENKWKPSVDDSCANGCSYSGKCLPIGTKVKEGGHFAYCSWEGKMSPQLGEGASCQNNYECQSNSCANLKCLDLEKKLEEQQNLLDRILKWMERFWG